MAYRQYKLSLHSVHINKFLSCGSGGKWPLRDRGNEKEVGAMSRTPIDIYCNLAISAMCDILQDRVADQWGQSRYIAHKVIGNSFGSVRQLLRSLGCPAAILFTVERELEILIPANGIKRFSFPAGKKGFPFFIGWNGMRYEMVGGEAYQRLAEVKDEKKRI
jgi:hypothetical protein